MVGDFILSRRMHNVYEKNTAEEILNETYQIFQQGDLNICNLETVITNEGVPYPKGEKNPYYFRSSTQLAKLLVDANIHAVTTGNNHSMDYGAEGIRFQSEFLDTLKIAHPGSGQNLDEATKTAYINVQGIVVALISFSSVSPRTLGATNDKAGVFFVSPLSAIAKELEEVVTEAKKKADIVIVSPHWTENWELEPEQEHRKQAKMLIDMGCDAVMGHSSHLLMGMETYKNKPIVYDMGTFLVDTIAGNEGLKYAGLFQLQIENNGISKVSIYPVKLSNGHVRLAEGSDSERIFDKLTSLEAVDSPIHTSENILTVELPVVAAVAVGVGTCALAVVDHNNQQKKSNLFTQKPDVVVNDLPSWCDKFSAIPLESNYTFLGFKSVESFRTGSGFLLHLAFKVGHKISGNFEIEIVGQSEYGDTFEYLHPLSNGVYNSVLWEEGEVLKDEVNVRVKRNVKPGYYKLHFGIKNIDTGEYIKTLKGETHILFSDIYVLPELISNLASGIDWDGKLPNSVKKKFKVEFMENPEHYLFAGLRRELAGGKGFDNNFSFRAIESKYKFDKKISLTYLTLFQDKVGWMRWGSRREQLKLSLQRNVDKLTTKQNFSKYDIMDSSKLGMLLEIVVEKKLQDIHQLLLDENLYKNNDLGFEFSLDGKIDDLYTAAECRYYHLYTYRQKIAFALIRRGIDDFYDLKQFIVEHAEAIVFRDVMTVSLLDYEGVVKEYTGSARVDALLFGTG